VPQRERRRRKPVEDITGPVSITRKWSGDRLVTTVRSGVLGARQHGRFLVAMGRAELEHQDSLNHKRISDKATAARKATSGRRAAVIRKAVSEYRRQHPKASAHAIAIVVARRLRLSPSTIKRQM
jgi:hypothetical protein